jgi:hypothetical protein
MTRSARSGRPHTAAHPAHPRYVRGRGEAREEARITSSEPLVLYVRARVRPERPGRPHTEAYPWCGRAGERPGRPHMEA